MREEIKELVATAVYTSSPQYPELDNRAANYKNIKYTTDQILTLLDKEIQRARVDELNRLDDFIIWSDRYEAYLLANPDVVIADRIKQLEKE